MFQFNDSFALEQIYFYTNPLIQYLYMFIPFYTAYIGISYSL